MTTLRPKSRRAGRTRPSAVACRPHGAVMLVPDGTLSVKEKVDVVLRDDAVFAPAAIPAKPKGSVGRSRKYPDFVWTMWPELRSIWESHTAVERELGRGEWWRYIRRELRRLRPELPELPFKAPLRQHFGYMRDRYLTTDAALGSSLESHIGFAVGQAREGGNLDPKGGGSFTHPKITRSLYGDGTVVPALYKAKPGQTMTNRETGVIRPVRCDPDAALFTEGGGNKVYGIKVVIISTRRPEERFILAIGHVDKGRDEAKVVLELLRQIKPHTPGAQALVYDMILRGEHLQAVMTEIGVVPVVAVHAKENPDRKKGRLAGTFVPKTADLEDLTVDMPDGTSRVVHIAAYNGAASVKELTETGEPYYQILECVRIQRHDDKNRYRWYGFYRLPEEYGGEVISLRLHQNEEDDKRVNRPENLRAIPEGSEDYDRLHPLRPDAESINRGLDDSLYIKRASALGWRALMVDLLGHARLVNAITLARCRARDQLRGAA